MPGSGIDHVTKLTEEPSKKFGKSVTMMAIVHEYELPPYGKTKQNKKEQDVWPLIFSANEI